MRVLPEREQDQALIRLVHLDAFRRPEAPDDGPPEVALVDELRTSDAWIPGLSLVAVTGTEVIGHVCTTRGLVDEEPVLALGPIGVLVAHQGRGVGSALVRETLRLSEVLGEAQRLAHQGGSNSATLVSDEYSDGPQRQHRLLVNQASGRTHMSDDFGPGHGHQRQPGYPRVARS